MKKRVIRIIEYEGDAEWVNSTMQNNLLKGTLSGDKNGPWRIRELCRYEETRHTLKGEEGE